MKETKSGRLLVVDDETVLMTALRNGLNARGYEAVGFSSPTEALKTLDEQDFDVLLTDLMMPEMDGIEFLRVASKIDPQLVGIVMTGQGTVQTAVEAMKVGAFDYVLKPFKLAIVLPVIQRALEVRRMRMENLQLKETVAIFELSQTIAFTLDLDLILKKVADAAVKQSQADEASIMLTTADGKELYVAVARGKNREDIVGERVPIDEGIAGWVASQREPLLLNADERDSRFKPLFRRSDIRSSISMPMQVGGKLVGILNLSSTRRRKPAMGEVKALSILTGTAASAIQDARLYEEVQKVEKRYRGIFENAVEGIYQSTTEGRLLAANPAMARIFGYGSPEEMISAVSDIWRQLYVKPKQREEFISQIGERGFVEAFESLTRRRDGKIRWVSENSRLVHDNDGHPSCYEGTIEDITDRKQAEKTLEVTNRRLEEAFAKLKAAQQEIVQQERLRALGTMASGIAHDFNNSLSPILGFSDMLLKYPKLRNDEEKLLKSLKAIHTAAQDAANIVSRLREFYRLREEDEYLPIQPNELIEQTISLTQPMWKNQAHEQGKTITIETDLQAQQTVNGNESELREMLTNLIFNAVDAISESGTVTIRSRSIEDEVVLEVADNGSGMTEEVRQKCLEPFFSTKGDKGTGMGLSMVFGTIKRHESTIYIETEMGKGTTFVIRFPIRDETGADAGDIAEIEPETTRPLHILVVDDERTVQDTVVQYLDLNGHTTVTAANGLEGLERFKSENFDLVLTDRAMPEMNGDQLAAAIKEIDPEKPVVMLTGFGDMMKAADEMPTGVDAILDKPVDESKLQKTLAKFM